MVAGGFGGAWSLRSALITGQQNLVSVMSIGMPVRDVEATEELNLGLLMGFRYRSNISLRNHQRFCC